MKNIQQGREAMKIIHIMADGSQRKSVEGLKIQSAEFYALLKQIKELSK